MLPWLCFSLCYGKAASVMFHLAKFAFVHAFCSFAHLQSLPYLFTAMITMKTDIDTRYSRRMSFPSSPRRFSLPNLRRTSKSTDIYLRTTSSTKNITSFGYRKEALYLRGKSGSPTMYTRTNSVDMSPVPLFLCDSPLGNRRTTNHKRSKGDLKIELQCTIFSWQPKTDDASPLTPRSVNSKQLTRSKTARKNLDDNENCYNSFLRRHSIDAA